MEIRYKIGFSRSCVILIETVCCTHDVDFLRNDDCCCRTNGRRSMATQFSTHGIGSSFGTFSFLSNFFESGNTVCRSFQIKILRVYARRLEADILTKSERYCKRTEHEVGTLKRTFINEVHFRGELLCHTNCNTTEICTQLGRVFSWKLSTYF